MIMSISLPVIQPALNAAPGGASSRGSHRLAEIDDCPRRWWLRWGLGLEAKGEPPNWATEGTIIHLALAYWFASKLPVKPRWFEEKTLQEALDEEAKGNPQLVALALGVLRAYTN